MKTIKGTRWWLLGFLAMVTGATIVTKISEYPNVATPDDNDLLLLASGPTNKNVKWSDARTAIRGGSGQAANQIMATPDGTTGIASLRSMVAADVPSLPASKITSGTFDTNRFPALVKDLGAISAVTGDLFYYDGTHLVRLPVGPEGFLFVISNGIPTYTTNIPSALVTNLTVITNNVTYLNVSQTIKVNGKSATVFSLNGTEMPIFNLKDGPAITFSVTGGTNGTPTIKLRNYLVLTAPFTADGAGAIISTNDNSSKVFGQAAFSGSAAASANFVEYRLTVPEDIDTSVDLKVERFKFRLGAADTAAHSYVISMKSVADSASFDSPTLADSVTLSFAGDASGASADVETISNVTLTGWKSAVTAGQMWVIRLARNGDSDASTQVSYSGPLVISYGSTQ